jgi:signal transduction histidine kinase
VIDEKAALREEDKVLVGEAAFRPRARLLRTLGHELITNQFIAVQELVKNAYDADAHQVIVAFEGPFQPGSGALTVVDDGVGMTLETVLNAWMEPATSWKVRRTTTATMRRVTGEKGIGRFASARVAATLELVSVSVETGRMVTALFDWGRFDDPDKYLDEIKCTWREEPGNGRPRGTTLRLQRLRDNWSEKNGQPFVTLRTQLGRLVSPVAPPTDFAITMDVAEPFDGHSGAITAPAFLGKPRYWLAGSMTSSGDIDAISQGPNGSEQILEHGKRPRVLIAGEPPACGPFSFEFRVWDRTDEDLRQLAAEFHSSLRDIRRDLNAASGVGIYRDGFRVLLPDNSDWLGLDLRRVQNPTLRLSNNQIVGVLSISRDANPSLVDQTNRQGLVDNKASDHFRAAVREILAKLEQKRDTARRPAPTLPSQAPGLFTKLSLQSVRDYVASNYAKDANLLEVVAAAERSIAEGVADVKTVLVRYRRLATLGQLIDGILHDGRTPLQTIGNTVRFFQRDLNAKATGSILTKASKKTMQDRLERISSQAELLDALFTRIAPFSGRRRGRPSASTLEHVLNETTKILRQEIEDAGAEVELPEGETTIKLDQGDMQMIFTNLLSNALYWVQRMPAGQRKIKFEIDRQEGSVAVTISDSGPGVPAEVRGQIMTPYFTTKSEGIGLGLALAGEIAAEYDGSLDLLAEGPLDGATFRVTLRRRIG